MFARYKKKRANKLVGTAESSQKWLRQLLLTGITVAVAVVATVILESSLEATVAIIVPPGGPALALAAAALGVLVWIEWSRRRK